MIRQRLFGVISNKTDTVVVGILAFVSVGVTDSISAQHGAQPDEVHHDASHQIAAPLAQQGSAGETSSPLNRRLSLVLRDVSLGDALAEVDAQAKLGIVYSPRLLPLDRKVSISMKNATAAEILKVLLQGTGVVARLSAGGRVILAAQETEEKQQQSGTVRGMVVDSARNEGLAGVTVTIQGSGISVVTDVKGMFILQNVPLGDHIVTFRFLGFTSTTRTITVTKEKFFVVLQNVRMQPSATMLSGVVTTATGDQKKIEVGNSIVSLNVDSLMKVAPVSNVTDLLESRVPGMMIQRTSGSPGDPARIRLRGTNSIMQNNDPIIVVDGIRMYSETSEERNQNNGPAGTYATPSPLDQIDPNAIERIDVFKGPSAAAMYGSDAANGVIVITTKCGQVGATRWRLSGDYGLSYFPGDWPTTWFKFVSSTSGGASYPCWGYCGDVIVDSLVPFQLLNNPRSTALGTGSLMNGSMSVNGGSGNTQYNLTVSTGNQLGVYKLPLFDQERYKFYRGVAAPGWMKRPDRLEDRSGNVRIDIALRNNTRVGISTGIQQQIQRRTSMSSQFEGAISQLQEKYVDFSVYQQESLVGNPYERVTSGTLNLRNALSLRTEPFAWLPIDATVGFNSRIQDNEAKIARDLLPGSLSQGAWNGKNNNSTDMTGRVNTPLLISSKLTLTMGAEYVRKTTNDQQGSFRGFADGVSDPAEGTMKDSTRFTRSTTEQKSFGWWLEPRFNMRSRLFVMPGFRLDNNGLRGKNMGFNGLPKINLSWIASDEPLFPLKDKIRMLRFKAAFGVAGVKPRPGQDRRLFWTRTYNPYNTTDSDYGNMLLLSHIGNASLRPERGVELEGGFDIELWNGRLTLDVTHANRRTKDAIITAPYSPSANGGSGAFAAGDRGILTLNLGDIRHVSTEIMASAQLIERRAVGLNVGMNMTRKRSKILQLRQDGTGLLGSRDIRYEVGYPMEAVWARPIIGFVDIDGDGMISRYEVSQGDSVVYVGSSEPNFQLSGYQNLTLLNGRLTLNAVWSYTDGGVQTRGWNGNSRGNLAINAPGVDLGSMAGWVIGGSLDRDGGQIGRMMVVDVLRLQSLSIGFNLGSQVARVLRARDASLSIQGRNLGLWTNYAGVDPNVNAYSTGNLTLDAGTLPPTREWRLRVALGW